MVLERWQPGKERCDFILNNGRQCGNVPVSGVSRCPMHGANKQLEHKEKQSLRLYRLAKHQNRVNQLTDHNKLKSLREEVALLRILLEEKWNSCEDNYDLLVSCGPISELIMKLERLVTSCNKLELSLGGLLDRTKVKQIASEMMNAVANRVNEYIEDPELVESLLEVIASDILKTLERGHNETT